MSEEYYVHALAREGNIEAVVGALAKERKLLLQKDEDERTPLHWACTSNNTEMVKQMMQFAQNVDLDDLTDASGWTPVHIAAALGNEELVGLFLRHSPVPDVSLATSQGTTALHLATSKNHYEVVKQLVGAKVNVNVQDKRGQSALHRAASVGSQPIVKALVQEGKARVNVADKDGWTPLHHALAEGHGDVGALLVQLGADPTAVDSDGNTAEKVAVDAKVATYFRSQI